MSVLSSEFLFSVAIGSGDATPHADRDKEVEPSQVAAYKTVEAICWLHFSRTSLYIYANRGSV